VLISGDGTSAALKATVSPQGGHGSNIPQELFATTLGISVNVEDFLTDFFLDNDLDNMVLLKTSEIIQMKHCLIQTQEIHVM